MPSITKQVTVTVQGTTTPPPTGTSTPQDPYLASFPLPPNNTSRGLHFCLDLRQPFITQYVPLMKQMKMSWTTTYGGDENTTTNAAKQLLGGAGVFSVIRVEARQERPLPTSFWDALTRKAIAMGLPPYIQLYNEPEIEWGTAAKFAAKWNERAQVIVNAGGIVGLQVMSQEFFDAAVDGMSDSVKKRFVFIQHDYGANHQPDYPYNKGLTPTQDDTCVLRFLAIADWAKAKLGYVMPIVGGEGGWLYQNADDKTLPPVDAPAWIDWHYTMYEWFRTGIIPAMSGATQPLPDYVFSITPWLIYASNWYSDSWFFGLDADKKMPLIDKLTNDTPYVRQFTGQL